MIHFDDFDLTIEEVRLPLLQAHLEMGRIEAALRPIEVKAWRAELAELAGSKPERASACRAVGEAARHVRQLLLALRRRADVTPPTNWQLTVFRRVAACLAIDGLRRTMTGFGRGAITTAEQAVAEATAAFFRNWGALPDIRQWRENEVADWRLWRRMGGDASPELMSVT